jgi:hypothetical protein
MHPGFVLALVGIVVMTIGAAVDAQVSQTTGRIPLGHFWVDEETGCEYVRGGSGAYTPRMAGRGNNHQHRGCR